ncbi:hypothetical protein ACFQ0M_45000 [Kitasatospora aburaviensis]
MPPADRFEWFRAAVSSDLMPVALSSEHTSDFRAEITNLELGTVRLSTFAFSPWCPAAPRPMCGAAIPSSTSWPGSPAAPSTSPSSAARRSSRGT